MHLSQVVILDELLLSVNDQKKIDAGQTSELEDTLTWLADNTAMTLAALSSTSLLDNRDDTYVSQTELDEMIVRTGFEAVSLKHIMRSSQNIAAATSQERVNKMRPDHRFKIHESSSTVPGARPRAKVYKYTPDVDHNKLPGFVTQHLRTVDTDHLKCVVLTDYEISPRQLSVELIRSGITRVSCYDGGVERWWHGGRPKYRKGGSDDGEEAELTEWLRAEAGVLVTHELLFRGCEADTVIIVATHWGEFNRSSGRRSPLTRAVAGLTLVTSDFLLSVLELRRDWDVEIVEKGTEESDYETGDSEDDD